MFRPNQITVTVQGDTLLKEKKPVERYIINHETGICLESIIDHYNELYPDCLSVNLLLVIDEVPWPKSGQFT